MIATARRGGSLPFEPWSAAERHGHNMKRILYILFALIGVFCIIGGAIFQYNRMKKLDFVTNSLIGYYEMQFHGEKTTEFQKLLDEQNIYMDFESQHSSFIYFETLSFLYDLSSTDFPDPSSLTPDDPKLRSISTEILEEMQNYIKDCYSLVQINHISSEMQGDLYIVSLEVTTVNGLGGVSQIEIDSLFVHNTNNPSDILASLLALEGLAPDIEDTVRYDVILELDGDLIYPVSPDQRQSIYDNAVIYQPAS